MSASQPAAADADAATAAGTVEDADNEEMTGCLHATDHTRTMSSLLNRRYKLRCVRGATLRRRHYLLSGFATPSTVYESALKFLIMIRMPTLSPEVMSLLIFFAFFRDHTHRYNT